MTDKTEQTDLLDAPEGDGLWITGLKVENFAGFTEFELDLSALTVIAGANFTGKSSLLEAIKATLKKGEFTDDMIRVDADRSTIHLTLSDGLVAKADKRRGKSPTLKVSRDGVPIPSPRALLDQLLDPVSVDPVAWLDGDRTQALLDSMPLRVSAEEVAALYDEVGVDQDNRLRMDEPSMARHALQVLAAFEKDLVGRRKMLNAEVKQLTGWVKREREQLGESVDPTEEIERLQAEAASIESQLASVEAQRENHQDAEEAVEKAKERHSTKLERVDDLEAQLAVAREEATQLEADVLDAVNKLNTTPDPATDTGPTEERGADIAAKLEILREQKGRYLTGLEQKGRVDAEAERLERVKAAAKTLDAGVKAFRAAPGKMLAEADLPVEGLEFKDGQLTRYDVPVSRLSGAETVRLAAQVAVHRVKQQRGQFVLLDGLEQLDKEQRAVMLEEVRASGVQWILTEVGLRGDVADGTVVVMGSDA
jgi:hypothetical protein